MKIRFQWQWLLQVVLLLISFSNFRVCVIAHVLSSIDILSVVTSVVRICSVFVCDEILASGNTNQLKCQKYDYNQSNRRDTFWQYKLMKNSTKPAFRRFIQLHAPQTEITVHWENTINLAAQDGQSHSKRCQKYSWHESTIFDWKNHSVTYLRFQILERTMFCFDCRVVSR